MEHYDVEKETGRHWFRFYSNGPKGKIKKMVKYDRVIWTDEELYNISFGDWDEEASRLNDRIVSNNNDRDKVLAAVAFTILMFAKENPGVNIIIIGNSKSRTRLYQIAISKFQDAVTNIFEIDGYINNEWKNFQKGVNYDAFLFRSKM